MRLYEPQRHRAHAALYSGHDPGVCCRMHAAQSLWLLGYPDQAVASIQAALALAQQLAHPLSLTLALYWAAMLHHLRREAPLTQARAEAAMTIATDQEFPATSRAGHAPAGLGAGREWARGGGHRADPSGPGRLPSDGGELGTDRITWPCSPRRPPRSGQTAEGLEALAEALATLAESRARWWEAELHRLRGALLLQTRWHSQGRRKPASSRPSPWPAVSRRNRWSCGPP